MDGEAIDFVGRPGLLDASLLGLPASVQANAYLLNRCQALRDVVIDQIKKYLELLAAVDNLHDNRQIEREPTDPEYTH